MFKYFFRFQKEVKCHCRLPSLRKNNKKIKNLSLILADLLRINIYYIFKKRRNLKKAIYFFVYVDLLF